MIYYSRRTAPGSVQRDIMLVPESEGKKKLLINIWNRKGLIIIVKYRLLR